MSEVKILVVEDSLTQAVKLQYVLEKNKYKATIAKNGIEALKSLEHDKPHIIISDIVMPEMDGYELSRRVKTTENFKDIPIILLTTLSDPADIIKGLESRADNFITKPYNEEFLLSRINHILLNKELRKGMLSNESAISIFFGKEKYLINSDRLQILDLLLSTYENAIQKNQELERINNELINTKIELERRNQELEELNEMKNHFVGVAAHDLRSPISSIYSYSDFMFEEAKSSYCPEEYSDFISTVKEVSSFMLNMVNELLDISVIESGEINLNLKKIDLISLMKHNIALNNKFSEKKNIKILFNYEEIPHIMVDRNKIEQVLNNLITNAVKFSHSGTEVEVSLNHDDVYVVISVKDEGQGIPEAELGKLFKPFGRTSVMATQGEASTGLGLAITRKIVEIHNGKIRVESHVGKGSIFYVSLPLKYNEEQ